MNKVSTAAADACAFAYATAHATEIENKVSTACAYAAAIDNALATDSKTLEDAR